jgi:hypothetical protein
MAGVLPVQPGAVAGQRGDGLGEDHLLQPHCPTANSSGGQEQQAYLPPARNQSRYGRVQVIKGFHI